MYALEIYLYRMLYYLIQFIVTMYVAVYGISTFLFYVFHASFVYIKCSYSIHIFLSV